MFFQGHVPSLMEYNSGDLLANSISFVQFEMYLVNFLLQNRLHYFFFKSKNVKPITFGFI